MLLNLIKFEWLFWKRKKSLYAMLAFYLVLGLMGATMTAFPFPDTNKNSPYVLNYLLGIISLICIFSTTILAAQNLFREKDAHFDSILFATPLRKLPYVTSRFLIIFCITLLCYLLFVCGLMTGHRMAADVNDDFGKFHLWHYLQPFLLLLVPNIIFCTAVACSIGLGTRNKMLVYVSGIFIYFLYWGVAIFTNSPLIANSAPVSATAMSWSARLDPFGLAAFLEQTRYWTAPERNTQLLQPIGNLLVNRLLYLAISILLLLLSYNRFSLQIIQKKKNKNRIPVSTSNHINYRPAFTRTAGLFYHLKSLWSLVKIELLNIVKNIPLWVICLGWAGFFCIESFSDLAGNSRFPQRFATTGILTTYVLSALPVVGLIVILFYGSEVFWRSQSIRFAVLEDTTAVKPLVTLLSKWLPLLFVLLVLICLSILICIACQLVFESYDISWGLYASLFYLIGLPLALNAALIVSIQAIVKNRYLGITISGIVLAFTSTSIGNLTGIKHPLLKFANTYQGAYSDMNGFGSGIHAFNIKMLYALFVMIAIFILASSVWQYKKGTKIIPKKVWRSPQLIFLLVGCVGALTYGHIIYTQTILVNAEKINTWKQVYEEKYQYLKNTPQPTITSVKTSIDLFPENESYTVSGQYTLVNKTGSFIDTLFMNGDKEVQWGKWEIENGAKEIKEPLLERYTFVLKAALKPGDSTTLKFGFQYHKSPFNAAASYNTIIHNGSFSRISRYFPITGYNTDNEIDDPKERKKRNMPPLANLLSLSAPRDTTGKYDFINLDVTVSTSGDQTAIALGELTNHWKKNNRNYFHYVTSRPVPFRFAIASANYRIKELVYNGVRMEVYYYPGHYQNIDHLVSVAKQSLDYCEKNIAAYPDSMLRFIEIASFTKGFAGTAYPTALFINESFGFQNKIDGNPGKDILNEMVSHELSHAWWGNAKISPDYREGSKLMTETLAMYAELMVYKKTYGDAYLLDRVNVHKNIYLDERRFSGEEPLYRSDPEKSYLFYDKGIVVMYQLYKLLGETKINTALRAFYNKYAYPNLPPLSTDLLNEFYAVADKDLYAKINELFKKIVIYELALNKVAVEKNKMGYSLSLDATARKYEEDGKGTKKEIAFTETVEALVYFKNGEKELLILPVNNNKIHADLSFSARPIEVVLDPAGKFLDMSGPNKEKKIMDY